jgi:hypothetical protein
MTLRNASALNHIHMSREVGYAEVGPSSIGENYSLLVGRRRLIECRSLSPNRSPLRR